jgi:hypothetical protein
MIMGECPNCDEFVMNPYAGKRVWERCKCDSCGKPYWLFHSSFTPEAVTEEAFLREYVVDEATKRVRPRAAPR